MPHLQFDTDADPTPEEKEALAAAVTDLYTDHMETTAGHVAVTIRDRGPADLQLGRAVDGPLVFLDADIREGRPFELKRAFALATMEYLIDEWNVPEENLKVTFTEHAAEGMMGYDRVGGDWEG
ncbi:tautomerase family protein [Halobaculum roseum]|uniref:Tautomerase family protein n=1 Tax=Halobaculum roseum TaxID=2175149 RepID=A0ABD5MN70_9EURY|nr:tautomerase family protein [Halobaculum roseum]QZY03838.1 tautomerase family protein [Halobaculum roseum]